MFLGSQPQLSLYACCPLVLNGVESAANLIRCGPLGRQTPDRADHPAKIFRWHVFAKRGSGRLGDVFFHQPPAKIVSSGVEPSPRALAPPLHPRHPPIPPP